MKKLSALILFFALSNPAIASGPYDGIYAINLDGQVSNYASVHEVDNRVVVIIVDTNPNNTWGPGIGTRIGESVILDHIAGVSPSDVKSNVTINFNNNGATTLTINSCTDGHIYFCGLPAGVTVNLDKIF